MSPRCLREPAIASGQFKEHSNDLQPMLEAATTRLFTTSHISSQLPCRFIMTHPLKSIWCPYISTCPVTCQCNENTTYRESTTELQIITVIMSCIVILIKLTTVLISDIFNLQHTQIHKHDSKIGHPQPRCGHLLSLQRRCKFYQKWLL